MYSDAPTQSSELSCESYSSELLGMFMNIVNSILLPTAMIGFIIQLNIQCTVKIDSI